MKIPFGMNIQNMFYVAMIALVLGASVGGGSIWYVRGLQIKAITSTNATERANMATKVAVAQGETNRIKYEFQTNLEVKRNELDNSYKERVGAINTAVNKLDGIRLRDPSASSNSKSTGGQGNTQGDNGSATGELSLETSRFLWSFAGDADTVRERLQICKTWNDSLMAEQKKYVEQIEALRKQLK